jgi:hypothetical protein
MRFLKISLIAGISALTLSGCQVAKTTGKVAALPFKAVYKTGEFAGKTVYKTGELAGKTVYKTGELAGKSVYYTGKGIYKTGEFAGKTAIQAGKGIYYIGTVPVKITDKALDTTAKVLTVTTQAMDVTGNVLTTARTIQSVELEAELAALKGAKGILNVVVDAIS